MSYLNYFYYFRQILELQSIQTSLQNEINQHQIQNEVYLNQYSEETKKSSELLAELQSLHTQLREKVCIIYSLFLCLLVRFQ